MLSTLLMDLCGLQVHSPYESFSRLPWFLLSNRLFAFPLCVCAHLGNHGYVGGLYQLQFLLCIPLVNLESVECLSNPDGYLTSQNLMLNTLLLLPCLQQTGLRPQARELCA